MSDIKFRLAAKTDVGCVRTNNEDNFQAAADLTESQMRWVNNQTYDLGEKGALLVVADGMGGMNAGEVASEIAIETVRDFFTPERITPDVLKTRFTIEKFMKDVVVEADRRIKEKSDSKTHGMGTTIVMAWLLGDQCYVCWCGDSRAYIYNPDCGLFQVSKDHSYVQSLVDAGEISEEDAFDYPNSNVITRCLCDAKQKAVPDCLLSPQPLCDGDIILLCSDGLSGMLRDKQMQEVIEKNKDDMNTLSDALIDAALAAGGNDNVTVAVATIDSGGQKSTPARIPVKVLPKPHNAAAKASAQTPDAKASAAKPKEAGSKSAAGSEKESGAKKTTPAWIWVLVGFIAAAGIFIAAYFVFFDKVKADTTDSKETELVDPKPADSEMPEDSEGMVDEGDDTGSFEQIENAPGTTPAKPANAPAAPAAKHGRPQAKPVLVKGGDDKSEPENKAETTAETGADQGTAAATTAAPTLTSKKPATKTPNDTTKVKE